MQLLNSVLQKVAFLLEKEVSVDYLAFLLHHFLRQLEHLTLGLPSLLNGLVILFIHDLLVSFADFQLVNFLS